MEHAMSDPTPGPEKPSLAGTIAILVIGLVILVPSGLCTGFFTFGQFFIGRSFESGFVAVALLIGGPFVAIGIALIMWGIRRLRR
jgi:hypothetical protein